MTLNVEIDHASNPVIVVENLDDATVRDLSATDKLEEMTEEAAAFLSRQIGRLAGNLRPDLEDIGASKATVRFAMKLFIKNGQLTSWVSEVGAEGSVEVSVEFTR